MVGSVSSGAGRWATTSQLLPAPTFTVASVNVLPLELTDTEWSPALTLNGPATAVAFKPFSTSLPSTSTSTVAVVRPCTR